MSGLIDATIHDMIAKYARETPDNDCIVAPERNVRWSWKDVDEITDKVARGFMAMGIKPDDKVAIWSTNTPEWLLTAFAASKIGAVLVTVNTNYKKFEIEYLLRQSDTMTLIMIGKCKDSDYIAHINELNPGLENVLPGELKNEKLPFLKNLIYIGEQQDTPAGFFNFEDLYKLAETVSASQLEERKKGITCHDVVNMQYTSGTTGFPKGVMLTHHNIVNNGVGVGDCMLFTPKDRLLIVVPLFHCFGIVLGVMSCITHGSAMILVNQFDADKVMQVAEQEKCTALHGVPTMFIALLEHPNFEKYDLSTLRTGIMAGSPCPIEVMRRVSSDINMKDIVITFGQTESSPAITNSRTTDSLELRVSTIGQVMPHVEAKIVDPETGEDCPYGVQGEIVARGYNIMKGYYKMEEATKQAIDSNGWLHTGDIGTMDEDGYFKVTGRLKDMIIRGGENIYPREVEEFMYTHKSVRDVQVVGVPDIKYGEEICAYVILKDGEQPQQEELIKFVKEGLSRYKAPRYVLFVEEFPMTASGKIQKYKLREDAIEKLDLHSAANVETA